MTNTDTSNWEYKFAKELRAWFAPVVDTEGKPDRVLALLHAIGWRVDVLEDGNQQDLISAFNQIVTVGAALFEVLESPPRKLELFLLTFGPQVEGVVRKISRLADALPTELPIGSSELPADILNFLTISWLRGNHPYMYRGLRLAGVIQSFPQEEQSTRGSVFRVKNAVPHFSQERLLKLFEEPDQVLREAFWPIGVADADGAIAVALELWKFATFVGFVSPPRVVELEEEFESSEIFSGFTNEPDSVRLSKLISLPGEISDEVGLTIRRIPVSDGGPGAVLSPFGQLSGSFSVGDVGVELRAEGIDKRIRIDTNGIQLVDEGRNALSFDIGLSHGESNSPALSIGAPDGFLLTIETLALIGGGRVSPSHIGALVGAEAKRLKLNLAMHEADNFLSSIVPVDGISAEASVVLEWTSEDGISLRGSGGISIIVPQHLNLGRIEINELLISILISGRGIPVGTAATLSHGCAGKRCHAFG